MTKYIACIGHTDRPGSRVRPVSFISDSLESARRTSEELIVDRSRNEYVISVFPEHLWVPEERPDIVTRHSFSGSIFEGI